MSKLTLVIPDAHAHPDHHNKRFDLLSELIMDRRPDTIVCIGDFSDMPSLSSYDKGKKSAIGRKWKDDYDATHDALERTFKGVEAFNERARKNKDRQYKPRTVMVLGNHEDRINTAINLDPEIEGLLSIEALKYDDYWDEVIPYKQSIKIDGVMYSHNFASGVAGRPIGGELVGNSLLKKNFCSSTVGHGHTFNTATSTTADGRKMHGMSVGWFGDFVPDFAKQTEHLWWSGVVLKHDVTDGDYDLEQISLDRMRKLYA